MKLSDIKPLTISELKQESEFMKKYENCSAAELQLRLRSIEIGKERERRNFVSRILFISSCVIGIVFMQFFNDHNIENAIGRFQVSVIVVFLINLMLPDKMSFLDEETALKVLLAAKMSGEKI